VTKLQFTMKLCFKERKAVAA